MGFRFRKRIRIVEGLYLNLGNRSGSLLSPPARKPKTPSETNPRDLDGVPETGAGQSVALSR
jgi:hypothetical protein